MTFVLNFSSSMNMCCTLSKSSSKLLLMTFLRLKICEIWLSLYSFVGNFDKLVDLEIHLLEKMTPSHMGSKVKSQGPKREKVGP